MKHLKEYYKAYTGDLTKETLIKYFDDCKNNNVEGVKAFLDAGYYPDREIYGYGDENRSMNPLEVACKHGSIDVVKLFTQYDEFDFTKHSNLPLRYAMYENQVEIARLILDMDGISVNDGNVDYTFYNVTIPRKHYEMIKLFFEDGRVLKYIDNNSYIRDSFKVAAKTADLLLIKILQKYTDVPEKSINDYATIAAIESDNEKMFNILWKQDYVQALPNFNWYLVVTKRTKNFNIFKTIYDHPKSDPMSHNYNFFRETCELNRPDRINYMLNISEVGLDPTINRNEAIYRAARTGQVENMKLLMADERINPADNNNRALIEACKKDKLDAAELLLSDDRVIDNISSIIFPTVESYIEPLKFEEFPPMLTDILIKEFELENVDDLKQLLTMMKKD